MRPGQTIRRWALAALLALVSVGSWQAAERGDSDEVSTRQLVYERRPSTPVLSVRRLPRTLQAPVADDALGPDLQAAINASPANTCLVVQAGDRLLPPSANAETPLVPASNQKLLTTFVALELLGADFRFRTTVLADAAPAGGVVNGNLYLVGSGDPFLTTDDWWAQYDSLDGRHHTRLEDLADRVAAAGVTQVTGAVLGDESLYDANRTGPWAARLVETNQSGPLSALAVNEGFTDWSGRTPGVSRGRVRSQNPPLDAAAELVRLLEARGVTFGQPAGAGPAPAASSEVARIDGPTLAQVVTHINSYSSNIGAELLLKRLGLLGQGVGSTQAGAEVVLAQLDARGIPTVGLQVDDGSGLAETNRVSCRTLAAILTSAGPSSPLADSLSISGTRGSLEDRFEDTTADERVLAKTGTLKDVLALSGFVHSASQPDAVLTFAYITNETSVMDDEAARLLQDALVVAMTGYPEGPSQNQIGPGPALAS